MARVKVDPHITELVLNHTKAGTLGLIASVYNRHPYVQEMRDALTHWANHVATLTSLGAEADQQHSGRSVGAGMNSERVT